MQSILTLVVSALLSVTPPTQMEPVPVSGADTVVWAVGDLCNASRTADCDRVGRLIANDTETDAVLVLGDTQYPSGSLVTFNTYYDPKMGRGPGLYKRTLPAVGNHEYGTAGAAGYFDYFGLGRGTATRATTPPTSTAGT